MVKQRMRTFRPYFLVALLLLLLVPLIWLVWLLQGSPGLRPVAPELPTLVPTAVLPTVVAGASLTRATLPPTFTPAVALGDTLTGSDTVTPLPTPSTLAPAVPAETGTATPGPSPQVQASMSQPQSVATELSPNGISISSAAPSPTPAFAGRPCPDDPRLKPEYRRYYLSDQPWPAPAAGDPVSHLWLSRPFPGSGRFLSNQDFPYGYDGGGRLLLHNGIDSAEPLGTPVLAVGDGTVIVAQDDRNQLFGWRCNWYGHLVVQELDQTWMGQPVYVLYGHVLEIVVEPGQRISRGQQLAEVGIGGAATAAHLHLEIRVGRNDFGATRNPALWIDPASRGVITGRLLDPFGRPWRGVGLSLIGHSPEASSGNTWSYMADPLEIVNINPDESLAENFVFSDVKPGDYEVYTKVQGVEYRQPVTVYAGQVSTLEIVTQAYMTPTPSP